ncbi:MAG: LCP family protein [Acidimicrobiia bacterium]|nr:LCP family protein [Acidimicrobiia bacterium]
MSLEGTDRSKAGERVARSPLLAALLSAIVPGAGQLYAGQRRRGIILLALSAALIVAALVWVAADPIAVAKLAFEPSVLKGLLVADVALLAFRIWATWDAYRSAAPPSRPPAAAMAAAGIVAAAMLIVPHALFASYDLTQLDLITSVFAGPATTTEVPTTTSTVPPQTIATTSDPAAAPTTPAPTTSSTTTTTVPPTIWDGIERVNILLLGSDAGLGREGVRTDTIILASVDPANGDTVLFSIPRNFVQVPLPDSIDIWSCDCFPSMINGLYGFAERNPDVFPGSIPPGATALKLAIGEMLGLPVHYYSLVALDGFVDIVNALGGVTITVTERIYDSAYPKEGGGTEVIDFQPGVYNFDGHDALAYARSRQSTDDYNRMGRQRCVVEALAAEADPVTLLRGFPAIAEAIKRSVETDIPLDAVPDLIELAALVDTERAFSVALLPPLYISGRSAEGFNIPNVDLMREHAQIATTLPAEEAMALLGIDPLADDCGR